MTRTFPENGGVPKKVGRGCSSRRRYGLKGKPDSDIYEFCKSKRYVLVTFDHEFGFEYLSRKDLQGLVIVRIHPQTMENIHTAMKNFFLQVKTGKLELKNRIAVIEKDRIRLRKVG